MRAVIDGPHLKRLRRGSLEGRRCEEALAREGMAPVSGEQAGQEAEALWYVGPERAEIRAEPIAPPRQGEVLVRALYGAVSRGTERLVFAGRVPETEHERMRGPNMGGAFPFPVKYGYAAVGRIEHGPAELIGKIVFALHPHQSVFTLP